MNAGAYGGELRGDARGGGRQWAHPGSAGAGPALLDMRYRHSNLEPGEVVAEAILRLRRDDPGRIRATVADMQRRRREAQPAKVRTFGSVWKNPPPDLTAGRLLPRSAGSRGSSRVGPASRPCTRTSSRTSAVPGRPTWSRSWPRLAGAPTTGSEWSSSMRCRCSGRSRFRRFPDPGRIHPRSGELDGHVSGQRRPCASPAPAGASPD